MSPRIEVDGGEQLRRKRPGGVGKLPGPAQEIGFAPRFQRGTGGVAPQRMQTAALRIERIDFGQQGKRVFMAEAADRKHLVQRVGGGVELAALEQRLGLRPGRVQTDHRFGRNGGKLFHLAVAFDAAPRSRMRLATAAKPFRPEGLALRYDARREGFTSGEGRLDSSGVLALLVLFVTVSLCRYIH